MSASLSHNLILLADSLVMRLVVAPVSAKATRIADPPPLGEETSTNSLGLSAVTTEAVRASSGDTSGAPPDAASMTPVGFSWTGVLRRVCPPPESRPGLLALTGRLREEEGEAGEQGGAGLSWASAGHDTALAL